MTSTLICRVTRRGVEDSEFYFVVTPDGRQAIQKRLIPGRHVLAGLLPRIEKNMLAHLGRLGLPVAAPVGGSHADRHSVATEFVGPNLRFLMLEDIADAADAGALWARAADTVARFAEAGVLVTDLAARNIPFRLRLGLEGGPIDLSVAHMLDHALTVSVAPDAPRQHYPLWASPHQASFAPELREAISQEQALAIRQLQAAGHPEILQLGDIARGNRAEALMSKVDVYAGSVQAAMRSGALDPDRAMQFALGQQALELATLLRSRGVQNGALAFLAQHEALWQRMTSMQASARCGSMREVAHELGKDVEGRMWSVTELRPVSLRDLILRPDHPAAWGPDATLPAASDATEEAGDIEARWAKAMAQESAPGTTASASAAPAQAPAEAPPPSLPLPLLLPSPVARPARGAFGCACIALFVALAGEAVRPHAEPADTKLFEALSLVAQARRCLGSPPGDLEKCAKQLRALAQDRDARIAQPAKAALAAATDEAVAIVTRASFAGPQTDRAGRLLSALARAGHEPAARFAPAASP